MKTILAVRASLHFYNYKIKIKLLITVFNIIFPVSGVFSWRNNFAFASVINKRTYSSKEEYWPYCSWKCSSEGKRECTRMSLNICTVTAYLFWNKLWGEWIKIEVRPCSLSSCMWKCTWCISWWGDRGTPWEGKSHCFLLRFTCSARTEQCSSTCLHTLVPNFNYVTICNYSNVSCMHICSNFCICTLQCLLRRLQILFIVS